MQLPMLFDEVFFRQRLNAATSATAVQAPFFPGTALHTDLNWNAEIKEALGRMYGRSQLHRRMFRSLVIVRRLMSTVAPIEHAGEILKQVLSIEWLVHVGHDQPWHRDHVLHPARVTMIGNWILDDANIRAAAAATLQAEWQARADALAVPGCHDARTWEKILRLAWSCAGLFHDHAYPAQLVRKIATEVDEHFGLGRREPVDRTVGRYLAHTNRTHFYELARHDPLATLCEEPHAPMGGVALLCDSRFGRGRHPLWDLVLEIAALAVFRHHAPDPVHFDRHPVTFILALCDGLQEWDRVSFFFWSDVFNATIAVPPTQNHLH